MSRLNSEILARERQEALYGFLAGRKADEWIPLREIPEALPLYPESDSHNFHNSTARRWITADIEAINENPDYKMIIVSGRNGVKLATEREANNFLLGEYAEIFRKLKRVRTINSKVNLDGQLDIEGIVRTAFMEGS